MIGRKIVDRVDELLHAPELNFRLPPPLRIDTGRRLTTGTALNELTNVALNPKDLVSPRTPAHPVFTPNTGLTFGMPNPAAYFPARLKLSLTERDTEPNVYVALKQERWREEKRQYAADKEVEVLTQHLSRLKANRGSDQHEDEDRGSTPALNNEAKRRANLAHFFDHSPTRTSFNINLKCRLALDQPFPRRMTMGDVSPLRLRPSSVTPALRRLTTKHARPPSMAENSAKARSVSDRSVSSRSSRLTAEAPSESVGSEGRVSTRPSTPPLSVASASSSSSQGIHEETGGIATIISHVTSRTRSEILADLDKDVVHVPDYAVNLLGGFDLIHDEFSLPDRELFTKPREMKPIEVAPPPEPADSPRPSEESDMGPYRPFALPQFTVEPSWSHLSLNSPLPSTPRMHRPSLQPLTPDSSSFSRSSTPTTPRPSHSSKGPRSRFVVRSCREPVWDQPRLNGHTVEEAILVFFTKVDGLCILWTPM
ncbi:hypothetical protein HD554DRAFT_1066354 [Boletus coccyginus]|nr:hypothetical protein HD554DRAFT_1066354 [Boletus coccyginus]